MDGDFSKVADQIERLVNAANKVAPVPPARVDLPGNAYKLVWPDGKVDHHFLPVKPRTGGLLTLASAAMLVLDLVRRGDLAVVPEPPVVGSVGEQLIQTTELEGGASVEPFVGPAEAYVRLKTGCKAPQARDDRAWEQRLREDAYGVLEVEVVLDAADRMLQRRENRAVLTLSDLRTLKALQWLETQRPMLAQKEMIALCRTELGLVGSPFVKSMRSIKINEGTTVNSVVGFTKDSLGVQADNELDSNDGNLPEMVAVCFEAVPGSVLGREHQRLEVACTVVVHPKVAQFQLIPLPGELDRVKAAIADDVAEALGALYIDLAGNATNATELRIYRGWLNAS